MLPGIVGTIQATETIKLLLGIGDSLSGKLLTFDTLSMDFRTLKIYRDEGCEVCASYKSEAEQPAQAQAAAVTQAS